MVSGKISKRTVDALGPGATDIFLWDSVTKGFGLKVTPRGKKVYLFQYRPKGGGPAKRITIGPHGELTPDQAAKFAERLRLEVLSGGDPVAAAKAAREASEDRKMLHSKQIVANLVPLWLSNPRLKDRTRSFYQSAMDCHILPVIGKLPLPLVKREHWTAIRDSIPPASVAARRNAFATLSAFCAWADNESIAPNVTDGLKPPPKAKSRDRVLDDQELRSVWLAAEKLNPSYRALYRLAILTGQRRDEIAGMTWAELSRSQALWEIPGERTKNGVPQIVHLSALAIEVIDDLIGTEDWPAAGCVLVGRTKSSIAGFSKAKRAIDDAIEHLDGEVAKWRFHDLRRTLATGLQRLGIRLEVTEAILNHVSGSMSGVKGIYQRHDWKLEKQAALDAWAAHLSRILKTNETVGVIDFEQARINRAGKRAE
tara:strand:- start:5201 stop:6478 length:1278 start_codon:yes stop_codon:yes gene_type:complete